ncbi:MAG TPA: alpha/beta fold hydrolase, partial [Acidimicrobiales bacterium]|nr:alpha/beta fold hydrolase [Acidimicrobiales bacterium]
PVLAEAGWPVVALDHRGHARGIRGDGPFSLEDCADDAAALLDALDLDDVIAVGYSMGGPVAQLLWQRHRAKVAGLVLCATSRTFNGTARERAMFAMLGGACATARRLREAQRADLAIRLLGGHKPDPDAWRTCAETHDWVSVFDAGRAIGRFDSRPWASTIDVPTSVVVTTRDHVVPPSRQLELAAAIPGASVHPVRGDHAVCVAQAEELAPALLRALDSVASRLHAERMVDQPLAA